MTTHTNPDGQLVLTDEEMVQALWAANIPSLYHGKTACLHTLRDKCEAASDILDWLPNARLDSTVGACFEIPLDGRTGMDLTYTMARSLLILRKAVICYALPKLAALTMSRWDGGAEEMAELATYDYVFLTGFHGKGDAPYNTEKMYELQWVCRGLLLNNKSIVVQGDGPLENSTWWPPGFTNLFASKRARSFAPVVHLAKPTLGPAVYRTLAP